MFRKLTLLISTGKIIKLIMLSLIYGFNLYPRYRDKDYLHLLDPKELGSQSSRSRVNSPTTASFN
jgi:hypothetical protein